ncbi:GyrI-like domain-containing protein [Mucilaginibacter ginsenosidivorax]|uniref:AraC family transcriptional regulator n=1 Tax=Mucilaginibacter ginsenosidivorax TaxID=862126 RepID=A0A5B8W864_9SPHI|nr:effector binding domain-containing protein [Mucilaginibacter ginsenosidivorax]QEC79647.1 AraC family transcriptional regulator [Mucilaginibacter ginsenosidivorax]
MNIIEQEAIHLIGLSLKHQTINANGQSAIDCGNLWTRFEKGNYAHQVPDKINEAVFAVYHDYLGDYTQPYSYFIGCKVQPGTYVPSGLDSLIIPPGSYFHIPLKGKMPDMVADGWQKIWQSDLPRAYRPDFEVYDKRSENWERAEADIFLSVKPV